MIGGQVNARREAVVELTIRGPTGAELEVGAIVDTGYSGSLTLPAVLAVALRLVRQMSSSTVLADGSVREFDVCVAEVNADGIWSPVVISVVGDEPLLGMGLLAGHELWIEVRPGGDVEVRPLP